MRRSLAGSMPGVQGCPPNMSPASAYLTYSNVGQAIDWLQALFGFQLVHAIKDETGAFEHACMRHRNSTIMLGNNENGAPPEQTGTPSPVTMYLYVEDVDALLAKAEQMKNMRIVMPAQDMFWGDRMGKISDPAGYEWTVATVTSEFDPANMPSGYECITVTD